MDKKIIIEGIIVAIIFGGVGFYSGMKFNQARSPFAIGSNNFQNLAAEDRLSANFGARQARSGNGVNFISGEIISKDDKSITIKLVNSGTKIILFSDGTEISKFSAGAANDLEIGKTISINGQTNQDGSLTAQTIQIRP
jgi:hypothetical protein